MIIVLRCGADLVSPVSTTSSPASPEKFEFFDANPIPTRRELKVFDSLAERFITDASLSLEEIAAQPDVPHQGQPRPAPQRTSERVRVIVVGQDAALQAVVSKLLRIDALWAEVAYVPTEPTESAIAALWGLPASRQECQDVALRDPARPTALIRDDHAQVVLGAAEIRGEDAGEAELCGEVIVDSETLYHHDPQHGFRCPTPGGVRLVPTLGAPGLAAVTLPRRGFWRRLRPTPAPRVLQGRALQAGGVGMRVTRDGVAHPRALSSITFYRHLRDGQFVRR